MLQELLFETLENYHDLLVIFISEVGNSKTAMLKGQGVSFNLLNCKDAI